MPLEEASPCFCPGCPASRSLVGGERYRGCSSWGSEWATQPRRFCSAHTPERTSAVCWAPREVSTGLGLWDRAVLKWLTLQNTRQRTDKWVIIEITTSVVKVFISLTSLMLSTTPRGGYYQKNQGPAELRNLSKVTQQLTKEVGLEPSRTGLQNPWALPSIRKGLRSDKQIAIYPPPGLHRQYFAPLALSHYPSFISPSIYFIYFYVCAFQSKL